MPLLAAKLRDRDPLVRESAIRALAQMGKAAAAARPQLRAALRDRSPKVRSLARTALEDLAEGVSP